MKSVLLFLAILSSVQSQSSPGMPPETLRLIWPLTDSNFTSFLAEHPLALVSFCTPWALQCKNMDKELKALSRSEIPFELSLGKVDTSTQINLALDYKVKTHPSVALFHGAHTYWYKGELVYQNIIRWVNKKRQGVVIQATSEEHIATVSSEYLSYLLTNQNDNAELGKIYQEISEKYPEILFISAPLEMAKKYLNNSSEFNLIAIRNFDDGNKVLSSKLPFKREEIENFVNATLIPHVFEITEETLDNTMRKRRNTAICLYNKESSEHLRLFEKLAAEKVSDLVFIKANIHTHFGVLVGNAVDVGSEWDVIRIVEYMDGYDHLFSFHQKISEENLRKFFEDYNKKALSVYSKTEAPPEKNDGLFYKLVASEFDDYIRDDTRSVILYLYEDNCSICAMLEHWLEPTIKLTKIPKDVVFAKMNMSHNEHPDIPHSKIPAFFAYVKRRKNHPVFMHEDHNSEDFRKFLQRATGQRFERSGKIDDVEESL